MPTLTEAHFTLTIDVLMRISLVLTAGLLIAFMVKRHAAFRHAVLVAGLVAAFVVSAAMFTMQVLPVSRWRVDLLGREGPDLVALSRTVSRAPSEPLRRPASRDHMATAIASRRGDKARLDTGSNSSDLKYERSLEPLAVGRLNSPVWLSMASAVLSVMLIGAILKLTGLGFSLLRLRRIVSRARPVAGDSVLSMLALLQRRIPMRHPLRLLESGEVSAPVATGVIGNYVLLPTGWVGNLSQEEMLAVLCHESAHLARRDHYVVILQELLASALWFHPVVHMFNHMLNRVREELCDNCAIVVVERAAYCETLLQLAAGCPCSSIRGATAMGTLHWSLEDRIRGILDERRPTRTKISGFARAVTQISTVAICGLIATPQLTVTLPVNPSEKTSVSYALPPEDVRLVTNEMTRRISKSFSVNGEQKLCFENLAGRVELVPSNGTTVEVAAIVRVGDIRVEDLKRLIDEIRWVEAPADGASTRWGLAFPEGRYSRVRYPIPGETKPGVRTVRFLGREVGISDQKGESTPSVRFDLRISLPLRGRFEVYNAIGPITGQAINSPLEVRTHLGVIRLDDVLSPITATSEFGDILISRLHADAIVTTGSGGIELSQVAQGRIVLSTRSGKCRFVHPSAASFNMQYSGDQPIAVIGGNVNRISSRNNDRRMELLSRGIGGPSITVSGGAGETIVETGL